MNIAHCSTEESKRRGCVLSQKAVVGCLNEAEPKQKGFDFLTFNLNHHACSLHTVEVLLHTQRNGI